jgi:hypothetical protein
MRETILAHLEAGGQGPVAVVATGFGAKWRAGDLGAEVAA